MNTLIAHRDRILAKHGAWIESQSGDETHYCFPSVWSREQFEKEYAAMEMANNYYIDHTEHVEDMMADIVNSVEPAGHDLYNPTLWKGTHWKWFFSVE